jgi:glycosyltransferase involved in cell wall biosynthesis
VVAEIIAARPAIEQVPGAAFARADRSLRVAWLGHKSATIGDGLRTYSREITRGLRNRGHEVVFIHQEPDLADSQESFAVRGIPAFQRRVVFARPGSRRRIADLLREYDVDIVHLSIPFSTLDFRLPLLCQELGIPIVATFHVPFARQRSFWAAMAAGLYRLYAPTLARCERVVVLGEQQKRLLLSLGVPAGRIAVLANGVDVDRYCPAPSGLRAELGADRIFSYIGRIDPEKQVDALVRAFLAESPPLTFQLVIVGSGVELARLRSRYRDRRIVFLGAVLDEARRIEVLRASDAFFLPSRVEALSIAMLEAMACGTAVVATDVGNDGEAIRGAGIVIDPARAVADLRTAIRSLIDSPARCQELGRLARQRALERFSIDDNIAGLLQVYHAALRAPGVATGAVRAVVD